MVWVAVGMEFGLDVGLLGPFPELFVFGFLGVADYEVKPLLFQGESSGVEFTPPEGQDEETEIAEVAQFLLQIGTSVGKGASGGGVAD